jgi:predicted dehydrogenase
MPISLGLVGLGAFGTAFADLYHAHPEVNRIALCDREPERIRAIVDREHFGEKFDPKDAYDSLDAICDSDLDAIVLITQPWLHAPQALQILESGKSVYSAVPILSVPDGDEILDWCDRLVNACQSTGKHYMLGETTYYHADVMYCRRRAAEGAFGHFVYAEGEYLHDVDNPNSNLRKVQRRRLDSKAGREWLDFAKKYPMGTKMAPMHYPTHSTSGPISIMGSHATKVAAIGQHCPEPDEFHQDEFANETALFQMSNGATMRICEYRMIGHRNQETARIFGSEASYKDHKWIDRTTVTDLTVGEMRDTLPDDVEAAFGSINTRGGIYGGHGGSHAFLVHEFCDAIAKDRVPAINIWEAARYMAPGVMAHKSAQKDGEWLDVPDWGDAPRD